MTWEVPRSFVGGTVAVLASGPSMSQAVADKVHAAGIPAIAVNNTHRLAPWAWMLYAADTEWWGHQTNRGAHQFAGLRVSCQQVKGVHHLRIAGIEGFNLDPTCVHTLGNSGAQALQVACKAGAKKVILLGFDMGGSHWHGEHKTGLRSTTVDTFGKWCDRLARVAPAIKAAGVDVVNCTPESRLKAFRIGALETELETECVVR